MKIVINPVKSALTTGEQDFHLLVRLQSQPQADLKPTPLNLVLVIDRSGSMQGQKLQEVKIKAHGERARSGVTLAITGLAFVASYAMSPVTIRSSAAGSPKLALIPIVYGLPSQELSEQARRREIWLGGCMVEP